MKWETGRQGTGYFKHKIFEKKSGFLCDLYLLKYPKGAHVPPHKDEVGFGKHYRANLVLWPAREGGQFAYSIVEWTKNPSMVLLHLPFLKVFRPDLLTHVVTKVEKGTRYVLSFGWIKQ